MFYSSSYLFILYEDVFPVIVARLRQTLFSKIRLPHLNMNGRDSYLIKKITMFSFVVFAFCVCVCVLF